MAIKTALLLAALAAGPAEGGAGSDAMPYLKIDAGARGAALAGAYTAAGDDALSAFYNPAGTALQEKKELLLAHNEWLEGLRNEAAAYVHPLSPRVTAFGAANFLLSGSMDRYVMNQAGQPEGAGHFSALEGALSAGISGHIRPDFYGGLAVKHLSQQAAGGRASSWAGDAGFLVLSGPWRLGGSASNFGGSLKFGSKAFSAPVMLRGGLSFSFLKNYLVAADAVRAGQTAVSGAFGAEARLLTGPREYFIFRAGYRTGRSRFAGSGVTAGVGVATRDLRIDYAFAPYGDLGAAHRASVSFRFGRARGTPYFGYTYGEIKKARPVLKEAPPKKGAEPAARPAERKKQEKESGKKGAGEVYFMW